MVQDIFLPLPNGAMVRDRYIIEGLLGKGGFGSVYLVKDRRVKGNLFALKEVIDPSKQERDRFTLEGEILRRLDHPGLPRVYHAFSDDAMFRAYLLMDYIEGPNLEILRQKQAQHRLPLMQVMRIMAPIIEAIAYLHSQQPPIIHRDIKPSNIIVLPAGNEAVLVDFGIAKEYEADSTTTSVRRCSPGYGAPEQYGSGTDTRTDIYGLAATFSALLTGKIPADSFQRMLQLGSKGVDPLVPIIQHMPDIPLLVSEAIQRAMSIDSNDRFATIGEFWQALQDGLPVLTNADGDVQSIVSAASLSSSLLAEDDFLLLASIEEGENAPRAQQVISTDLLQGGDAYTETGDATIIARRNSPATATPALMSLEQPSLRIVRVPAFSRKRSLILGLLSVILLAGVGIATTFWSYIAIGTHDVANGRGISATRVIQPMLPTATSSALIPTVTVVASPVTVQNVTYLTGTYQGSLTDTVTSQTSHMVVVIQQTRGHATFDGRLTLNLSLPGNSSAFTGGVDINNHFFFTTNVPARQMPLYFYGVVQPDGYLHGYFCSSNTNHCNQNTGYFTVGPRY
ncbi:MAG: serine/threonine protein kinase [Ktedonobacteraceae bacterium]